jgi:hypothetical protein
MRRNRCRPVGNAKAMGRTCPVFWVGLWEIGVTLTSRAFILYSSRWLFPCSAPTSARHLKLLLNPNSSNPQHRCLRPHRAFDLSHRCATSTTLHSSTLSHSMDATGESCSLQLHKLRASKYKNPNVCAGIPFEHQPFRHCWYQRRFFSRYVRLRKRATCSDLKEGRPEIYSFYARNLQYLFHSLRWIHNLWARCDFRFERTIPPV